MLRACSRSYCEAVIEAHALLEILMYHTYTPVSALLFASLTASRDRSRTKALTRDLRIVDVALIGNLLPSLSFYANTSICIIAGLFATLGALDKFTRVRQLRAAGKPTLEDGTGEVSFSPALSVGDTWLLKRQPTLP